MFDLFEDDVIYEGSLPGLVAASVREDAVETFVDQALDGESVDRIGEAAATPYIEKLLSEEVEKQFDDPKRPFIELVLNAIDARPEEADDYHVRVRTKHDGFVVADEGESMGIRTMLENFLLPFSSEKDEYEDIGRFGVGFYSTLQYCLEDDDARMVVKTNNGEEAYTAEFWSETGEVEDLQVRIADGGRWKQGTKIALHGADIDERSFSAYLDSYLEYFDDERARVTNWWRQVNDGPDGTTYREDIELPAGDGTRGQRLRMTLDTDDPDGGINLYSQGVLIDDAPFEEGTLHMSFPSAVGLVEGRNGFKKDEAFDEVVDGFYDMLVDAVEDHDTDAMRELVPELEDTVGRDMETDTRQRFTEKLFGDMEYVIASQDATAGRQSEYRRARRFLGDGIEDEVYGANDRTTASYWQEDLKGFGDLVEERTATYTSGSIHDVVSYAEEHGMELDGLTAMRDQSDHVPGEYRLVSVESGGVSPFIRHDGTIYINAEHEVIQEDTATAHYGRFVDVNRADGTSEDRIERKVDYL